MRKRGPPFFEKALDYSETACEKVRQLERKSSSYDEVVEAICGLGGNGFPEFVRMAHRFLLNQGIYTVAEDDLLRCCGDTIADGHFAKRYGELEEGYLSIIASDEEMKEYRRQKKETRGRWQGGGFGVEGAVKGAVTAGAMNAVGDVFHGIGDMISSGIDGYRTNRKKEELLSSRPWRRDCYRALLDDLNDIFERTYSIYCREKGMQMPPVSRAKKEMYEQNALAMRENAEKSFELRMMALQEYPFAPESYWKLLSASGKVDGEVLEMMEFFVPAQFLEVTAEVIGAVVLKQVEKYPESTYEEIDRKLACLDRLEKEVEEEAGRSTACREYVAKKPLKLRDLRSGLMEKRTTADDGKRFDTVAEMERYLADRQRYEAYESDSAALSYEERAARLAACKSATASSKILARIAEEEKRVAFFLGGDESAAIAAKKLETNDYKEGVEELRILAGQGSAEARYQMGKLYRCGLWKDCNWIVKKDYKEALKWYLLAVEQGDPRAQCEAAFMYSHGYGTEQNDARAAELYTKAEESGNTSAMVNLGEMYYSGNSVEQNYAKAMELFLKASELGGTEGAAEYWIAGMYLDGEGVVKDDTKALEWYQKSAEQGLADAQYMLGQMYEDGEGASQDYVKAAYWYNKAALQGNATAENNLALLYENGLGVQKDHKHAINLLKWAIDGGCEEAEENLKAIKRFWDFV